MNGFAWNFNLRCLAHAIETAVGQKPDNAGVSKQVILWQPLYHLDVRGNLCENQTVSEACTRRCTHQCNNVLTDS